MKKETLKILSVLMILALLLSVLAGCDFEALDGDFKTKEDEEITDSVEDTDEEDEEEETTEDTTEAPATSEAEDIEIVIEDGADGEVIEEETDGDEIPEVETSGDVEEPV